MCIRDRSRTAARASVAAPASWWSRKLTVGRSGAPGRAAPRPLEPEVGHGRGLALVDALSSSWVVDHSDGTIVTARVPLNWQPA